MPLNFGSASQSNDSGSGIYLNYNAKSGRFSLSTADGKNEIKPTQFIADFDNLQTGWYLLAAGMPPQVTLDDSLDKLAKQPTPDHKRGFQVNLYSKQFGGVARFSSSSRIVCGVIGDLYDTFERERGAHPGELPVIKVSGDKPIDGKQGVNYAPVFEIEKWAKRPAELASNTANEPEIAPYSEAESSVESEF